MSAEQALACALAVSKLASSTSVKTGVSRRAPEQARLTSREVEVAALIARGQSNRQIARTLVIALSTAERHVANILNRLALRSRTAIALWAVEHRLEGRTNGA
jgi:DNA-binding NarL/FixJ family response regulator